MAPMLATVTNLAEYTVTELAFALKRTVEEAYGLLRVRGELSGYKRAASGHLYFTLKDEKALHRRGGLARLGAEARLRAGRRARGDLHRPAHHLSRAARSISSWSSASSPPASAR